MCLEPQQRGRANHSKDHSEDTLSSVDFVCFVVTRQAGHPSDAERELSRRTRGSLSKQGCATWRHPENKHWSDDVHQTVHNNFQRQLDKLLRRRGQRGSPRDVWTPKKWRPARQVSSHLGWLGRFISGGGRVGAKGADWPLAACPLDAPPGQLKNGGVL